MIIPSTGILLPKLWLLVILSFNGEYTLYLKYHTEAACEAGRAQVSTKNDDFFDTSYDSTICIEDIGITGDTL